MNPNTGLTAGGYQIRASLSNYAAVSPAVMDIEILPGQVSRIEAGSFATVQVNDQTRLNVRAFDSYDNFVGTDNNSQVILTLPGSGFSFVPADGLVVSTTSLSGQQVQRGVLTLKNGSGDFVVNSTTVAGSYNALIEAPGKTVRRNGSTVSTIALEVKAGAPAAVRLLDEQGQAQNEGDVALYGLKHQVPVQVQLYDAYNNKVLQVRQGSDFADANFAITLNVTGSAVIDGQSATTAVVLNAGHGLAKVTNTVHEQVQVAVADVAAPLQGIDTSSRFVINFDQQPPEITATAARAEKNSSELKLFFTYDEDVVASGEGALITVRDGVTQIAGSVELSGRELTFTPQQPLTLNRCYSFDTTGSVLEGSARGDAVKVQQGTLCTPHVMINHQGPLFVLEGGSQTLNILYGQNVSTNNISNGRASLNGIEQSFNWYTWYSNRRTIQIPEYSSQADNTVQDGDLVSLSLSGYLNAGSAIGDNGRAPLSVANTLDLRVFVPEADFDSDGISNQWEFKLANLNPTLADSDGDGIADGQEDSDGDGLINLDEIAQGTKLDVNDTDSDGLSDGSEVHDHNTNPLVADTDGDGLSDGQEVSSIPSSDPNNRDSDGDTIEDKDEVDNGMNPSNPADASQDKDNDGLTNLEEIQLGTGVNNPDSDNDTISDGQEVSQGSDPLKKDTDDDGLDDNVDAEPTVKDTQPPVIQLINPQPGQSLLKGQVMTLIADASDNGRVVQVGVRVNGIQLATLSSSPYEYPLTLPADADSISFELTAEDTNGNLSSTGETSFDLVEDPRTTVIGRAVDGSGQGIANVTVTTHGLTHHHSG